MLRERCYLIVDGDQLGHAQLTPLNRPPVDAEDLQFLDETINDMQENRDRNAVVIDCLALDRNAQSGRGSWHFAAGPLEAKRATIASPLGDDAGCRQLHP